jgi:hypothetical protein
LKLISGIILVLILVKPVFAQKEESAIEVIPKCESYAYSENVEGPPVFHAQYVKEITATSTLQEDKYANYDAKNLIDNSSSTAWAEGKKDDGIGENIIMVTNDHPIIKSIFINNGFTANDDYWKKNNRVKELAFEVVFDDATIGKGSVTLSDNSALQFFFLGFSKSEKIPVNSITFTIRSIYPGTKYHDTCISTLCP